VLIKQGGAVF